MQEIDLSFDALNTGKPLLCVDFDGVLHHYRKGYADGTIYDTPTPGAREFVLEAGKTFEIVIFSSRARTEDDRHAMRVWLVKYGFPLYPLMCEKPPAFLTLDDRAMTFTGAWPKVSDLLAFKPWNDQLWGTRDFTQESHDDEGT